MCSRNQFNMWSLHGGLGEHRELRRLHCDWPESDQHRDGGGAASLSLPGHRPDRFRNDATWAWWWKKSTFRKWEICMLASLDNCVEHTLASEAFSGWMCFRRGRPVWPLPPSSLAGQTTAPLTQPSPCCSSYSVSGRSRWEITPLVFLWPFFILSPLTIQPWSFII